MIRTGYLHPGYPASLEDFGGLVALPRSGGMLLRRPVPGTAEWDAIGPYPLFCCTDWSSLSADLAALAGQLVSIVLVTDPFGPNNPDALAGAFSHGLVRYKAHSVIDLEVPLEQSACPHHRRNARKALGRLTVEELAEPSRHLDTWNELYAELIARHRLTGISAFSPKSFAAQFAVPGLVAFRAVDRGGETVGMVLWYCQGDVGYYHLAAYSPRGYAEKASYALFWAGFEQFRGRLRWLNLGAGAGATCDGSDGLSRFKRGWTPLFRPTYLGRHVATPGRYAELCRGRLTTDYFPAYRAAVAMDAA
jgi:hypothetical protein